MFIRILRHYKGGTITISDVPLPNGNMEIATEDRQFVDKYIRVLEELNILGDIEITFAEVKSKYNH
ncbi:MULTISPECIES: hypothetical protein [Paenibacillus]|uniref:Uncharacterized protein n=1 Tax=Paenibacillus artemisiicola TaxID=1172618 RepID=A0ABS3WBU1_9BACL|nr:hypothetical protein [Paenibacillus artemisiicola]MBO7745787.1 hypothetical protein [Paenibacillus artemisiicola]